MLKNISPLLTPDLLYILRAMGHGDQIAIVDANYPGTSADLEMVRLDSASATDVLDAVLSLMPLDSFVPDPAICMQVVGDPRARPPIFDEFDRIIGAHESNMQVTTLERMAFYERAKEGYALIQTGERRFYGNIILKKGVIPPDA